MGADETKAVTVILVVIGRFVFSVRVDVVGLVVGSRRKKREIEERKKTDTQAQTQTDARARTHTHTHARTRARTHARTHARALYTLT